MRISSRRPVRVLSLGLPLIAALAVTAAPMTAAASWQVSGTPGLQQADTAQEIAVDSALLPIPASRFAEEEARANQRLREIEEDLVTGAEMRNIFQGLQEMTATIDRMSEMPEMVNPSRFPLRRIETLRAQWLRFDGRLSSWQETLDERVEELTGYRADLDQLSARLEATDSALAEGDAAELIRLRIQELEARIASMREGVEGLLAATLAVQERVSREQARVLEQIAQFDERLQRLQEQLLERDAPPIWSVFTDEARLMRPTTDRADSFAAAAQAIKSFAANSRNGLLFQVAFVAFLALALILLRRRTQGLDELEEAAGPRVVLRHPVATAVIAGLSLTIPLYPASPVEVTEIALLISVPAILTLLPGLVWESVRAPLFFVTGLVALDVVAANLDWLPLLGRFLLLLETALALTGALWFLRPSSAAHELSSGRWWRASLVLTRVGSVLLAVALLANVLGNQSLAEFLTQAVVRSGYAAVFFYSGSIVASGIIALLPHTDPGQSFRMFRHRPERVVARGTGIVRFLALLGWIWSVLHLASLWTPLVDAVSGVMAVEFSIGTYTLRLGSIALFAVAVWLAFKVSQLIRFLLEEEVLERFDLPKGIPATISTLTHWTILGIGLVLAAGAAGIDFTRIAILAGALGVGIGFGLQNLVNNFVSGLILVFERPIAVGDWVEVGTLLGQVQRIGMRSSTVRTLEGAEVIVPNGHLIQTEVTNWTLSDRRRRVEVLVGVRYGTDPERVLRLLRRVAENHPEVLAFPEPSILFMGFGDSSLNFSLRAWTHTFEEHLRVRSELTVQVNDALKEEGIEIPFPQRDLHFRTMDAPFQTAVRGIERGRTASGEARDPGPETASENDDSSGA